MQELGLDSIPHYRKQYCFRVFRNDFTRVGTFRTPCVDNFGNVIRRIKVIYPQDSAYPSFEQPGAGAELPDWLFYSQSWLFLSLLAVYI